MTRRRNASTVLGLALVIPLLLIAPAVGAQSPPGLEQPEEMEPVADEELEHFVLAFVEVQELQEELGAMTSERIQESDLSEQRFNEINQVAQQSGDSSELSGVDDDELAEYRIVLEDLIEIQNEQSAEMVEVVEDEDLTVDRFNQIMVGMREDQELAARAQEALNEVIEEGEGE